MKTIAKEAMLNFKKHILPKVATEDSKDHYFLSHTGKIITHTRVYNPVWIYSRSSQTGAPPKPGHLPVILILSLIK